MGSRGGKAYLLLGVFVLSRGPGVSTFSLSAKAQRGLLGERSQLAYSLISSFNDFVGKKNSRRLYFTIRLSKSFRRIPAKIAYLTFLFCFFNFSFLIPQSSHRSPLTSGPAAAGVILGSQPHAGPQAWMGLRAR